MNADPVAGPELLERLPTLRPDELDALPFGVVQVDDAGVIEFYNKFESELANVPRERAEGRNFFTQVAPCTNNRLIHGRFQQGVASGELDVCLPYTFTYKMRPTNVRIHLYRDGQTETNWVLVQPR